MEALMFFAALVVGGVGQYLNARPSIPTALIKGVLALVGMAFYLVVDVPAAWTGQPLIEWLSEAWVWAAAVPGIASLIGLAPGLATATTPGDELPPKRPQIPPAD